MRGLSGAGKRKHHDMLLLSVTTTEHQRALATYHPCPSTWLARLKLVSWPKASQNRRSGVGLSLISDKKPVPCLVPCPTIGPTSKTPAQKAMFPQKFFQRLVQQLARRCEFPCAEKKKKKSNGGRSFPPKFASQGAISISVLGIHSLLLFNFQFPPFLVKFPSTC